MQHAPALRFTDHDTWAAIHHLRTSPPPPPEGPALHQWIHTLHVPVFDHQVSEAIDRVLAQHQGTNRRWLAIDGPSHLGKSSTVTAVLLQRAMQAPMWRRRDRDGNLQTPLVYVASHANQTSKGYLRSIATVCGLTDDGDEPRLHQRLAEAIPRLGVRLIVLDDAHFCRRTSDHASRLTDGLRSLLELPVPIVAVGIDMEYSAWLRDPGRNNDSVLQLRRRATRLALEPMTRTSDTSPVPIFRNLERQLARIEGFTSTGLTPKTMLEMTRRLDGSVGTMLSVVKDAALHTLTSNNRRMDENCVMDTLQDVLGSVA